MKIYACIFFILLTLANCFISDKDDSSHKQKYLFEVSYIFYGWGYYYRGFYIDRDGYIYEFDCDERWNPEDYNSLSKKDLELKYNQNNVYYGKLEKDVVTEKYELLTSIDPTKGISQSSGCMDCGYFSYTGYIFNENSDTYTPITIYGTDLAGFYQNTSDGANEIFQWLLLIHDDFNIQSYLLN